MQLLDLLVPLQLLLETLFVLLYYLACEIIYFLLELYVILVDELDVLDTDIGGVGLLLCVHQWPSWVANEGTMGVFSAIN